MTLARFFKSKDSSGNNRSLIYLNISQFLGVVNDNIFKLVMAFLLIDSLGADKASSILSATGAIYVIPFLLFSSSAGILADRFSKQKLLVLMKCAEIVVMGFAVFAFASKSVGGCFTLLFFLSTHSALFGPSKYGIIPELVPLEQVSRANGAVTSFTYLAIILGTFLASFLTDASHRNFVFIALFCLALAVVGCISATRIHKTVSQGSNKKINPFFVREIYYTLRHCRTVPHLLPAILGSAFFLFLGGFTQLNIIPFALQSLHLNEVAGGYLFLPTALGIAFGSYLAGKASRKRVELGLPCLAGFGIAFFFVCLKLFSFSLTLVLISLICIGILGGMFVVPFDTFIQVTSDKIKRGQTIGAANFLSFLGVLLASFLLYLFNQVFSFSSATGFLCFGIITLLASIIFTLSLSEFTLHFFSRKILKPLCHYKHPPIEELEKAKNSLIVIENCTWKKALLLLSSLQNVHYFLFTDSKKWHWYFHLFENIHPIPPRTPFETIASLTAPYLEEGQIPCLLLDDTLSQKIGSAKGFFSLYNKPNIVFAQFTPENKGHTYQFLYK